MDGAPRLMFERYYANSFPKARHFHLEAEKRPASD
jgi:hypothetical protein